ncbi:hypothetical protein E2C01_070064 [Portunus trituberculatus]|uniref:Uncharacterized protein n=1 Tax=Portunus trituberculatus TaxID=210409 RepID=A0A5B7HRQ4_PORTR|nr:hypothetical protein [Portunus trituberculatus]
MAQFQPHPPSLDDQRIHRGLKALGCGCCEYHIICIGYNSGRKCMDALKSSAVRSRGCSSLSRSYGLLYFIFSYRAGDIKSGPYCSRCSRLIL